MIAQRLSEIPVTALPATRIDKADVFELTVNVSWFEALKYMVEKRISAVPVKDGDSYIGYIDRFTFVHWAAQYAKKSMAQQGNTPWDRQHRRPSAMKSPRSLPHTH